jgi:hypothetical protein
MALSSGSKKSTQSDSDSDSDDEVRDELPFLHQDNEQLGLLLDNLDDMLREAKEMRKELRASLEDARTRVAELETQNLDAKLEIDSLKASPVVSDEVECAECSIFLADLALFKEKHASKCEEQDVIRVEVAELKSRPALLGACTSCPVLHGKIDEMHAYTVSLEATLKEPIPTSCSTCEMHALKNLELAHCVDRLQDENDELRKLMGWLSGHEPLLRIMIETYKRQDGEELGANKVGKGSGENIPEPPKTHHKNDFPPKHNHLRNRQDTTLAPPVFPPQTNDFQKPIKFVSTSRKVFFGKESEKASEEKPVEKLSGEKPSEHPQPKPNPKLVRFHCGYCGRYGHKDEFFFKRKREERMAKEWANKDKYHPSNGVLEPRVQMPRANASVRTVPAWGERKATGDAAGRATPVRLVRGTGQTGAGLDRQQFGFRARTGARFVSGGRGSGGWAGEFVGGQFARRSPPHAQYGDGRGRSFELERRDGPRLSFRGFGPPPVRDGWFPHSGYRGGVRGGSFGRKDGLECANPTFEQMARHWFYTFGTNPSAESFVRSCAHF